jgi:hypothetical protein
MTIAVIICLFSLAQCFIAFALLLRFLPATAKFARVCLRGMVILSFRLYRLVLTPLAPFIQHYTGLDILSGLARVVATTLLSLGQGLVLLVVLHGPMALWSIGLFIVHGLVIGLAWDELEQPGDLQMGAHIQ